MPNVLASMTGFARTEGNVGGLTWAWELRSVNGRGLDLRLRLPPGWDVLEMPLRETAGKLLRRGNVSANLSIKHETAARLSVDPAALEQVLALALSLHTRIPGSAPPRAEALLALPGVMRAGSIDPNEERASAAEPVQAGFRGALDGLVGSRNAEGERLRLVLRGLLDEIASLRDQAATEAAHQPAAQRARMLDNLHALLQEAANLPTERQTERPAERQTERPAERPTERPTERIEDRATSDRIAPNGSGIDRIAPDRIAQEVALLASRSDVREELDRLSSHIQAAHALLAEASNIGRRFDFLVQEFNREANTLCSKSASSALTTTGLRLKAAIEQLREQVQNIE